MTVSPMAIGAGRAPPLPAGSSRASQPLKAQSSPPVTISRLSADPAGAADAAQHSSSWHCQWHRS